MDRTAESRVVVGVDGSTASLAALRRAVLEAAVRGAVLVPLFAGQPSDRTACRLLDSALRSAVGGWPSELVIRPTVTAGPPGPALVAAVAGPDDLLVLGASGHRHWHPHGDHAVRHCRGHSPCPVLTVAGQP
ncbi:universal stress protein [Kitasatospora sp. CB01950]|uniref:universal stress protein n=1 Tax=Kitasatospora sp. CB01950 TaxID=1703930 RepID=UPI00093C9BC5|nr:universal stress protein [Kitasatospora sp. CB01950]